jgi:hypothetical protein
LFVTTANAKTQGAEPDQENEPDGSGDAPFAPRIDNQVRARMELDQLECLRFARRASVNIIDKIDRATAGMLEAREEQPMSGTTDLCLAFTRVARAMRQIVVLEQEVAGLREPPTRRPAAPAPAAANDAAPKAVSPKDSAERDEDYEPDDTYDAPDRDDTHDDDTDDYDEREFDVVLSSLRKTLARAAADLPFEERKRVMAEADDIEAEVRAKRPKTGTTSSEDAPRRPPTPGKGSRSPPDTG